MRTRVPCFGMFELTYRCNLSCVHCYVPSRNDQDELSCDEIRRIIDEAVDEGCISLLLTGGEPFVHPNFEEIFTYAKGKGIIVYIFSNGSHIPDRYFELFRHLRPSLIDISLYGASEEAYEATTGRPVFGTVMRNIRRLMDLGVRVKLKTTLLKTNVSDYEECRRIHDDLGLDLRLNALMTYGYDRSPTPGEYRLSPREVVELEAGDKLLAAQWKRSFALPSLRSNGDSLYDCGAGVNSFCVTPSGVLKICGTVQKYGIDLRKESFKSAWGRLREELEPLRIAKDHGCRSCELSRWCMQCPAWAYLDLGDEQGVVSYLCETTRLRAEAFSEANF